MAQTPAASATRSMGTGPLALFDSSIGLKAVMAVTGVILVGFLVGHFIGNSLIFLGPDAINAYAAALHANPTLLWVARVVLIISVLLHIYTAFRLTVKNKAARPVAYKRQTSLVTSYAARTMAWSGPILLMFILFHLRHLTFGVTPGPYDHSATDCFANVVNGFRIPWVAGFYILAQACLGLHLFHGVNSLFQSLGLNHPAYNARIRSVSFGIAGFITIGNILIPLSVLAGVVG